ncbi:hypothetical protein N7G274_008575 [Stereocaulon virgatum]|uniref:Uncharacterized protein n=1 Tax=Stereocaulon virgatum TaxID=373712 RepID=A0ABR3ZYP1_9LECA
MSADGIIDISKTRRGAIVVKGTKIITRHREAHEKKDHLQQQGDSSCRCHLGPTMFRIAGTWIMEQPIWEGNPPKPPPSEQHSTQAALPARRHQPPSRTPTCTTYFLYYLPLAPSVLRYPFLLDFGSS